MAMTDEEKAAAKAERERVAAEQQAAKDAEAVRLAREEADEAARTAAESAIAADQPIAREMPSLAPDALRMSEHAVGYTGGPATETGGTVAPEKGADGVWYVTDPNDGRRWPVTEGMAGSTFQTTTGYLLEVGEFPKE
jgi:hypothetical protein